MKVPFAFQSSHIFLIVLVWCYLLLSHPTDRKETADSSETVQVLTFKKACICPQGELSTLPSPLPSPTGKASCVHATSGVKQNKEKQGKLTDPRLGPKDPTMSLRDPRVALVVPPKLASSLLYLLMLAWGWLMLVCL